MELGAAFDKIRANQALAKEFGQNPEKVLSELGVDTAGLTITKASSPGEAPPVAAAGVCVSIGCIVCASVG